MSYKTIFANSRSPCFNQSNQTILKDLINDWCTYCNTVSNGDYIYDLGQLYTESYVSGKLSNIEQYY